MLNENERLCLSVPEAAQKIGLGRNAMYEAVKRKEIPFIRIGKRIFIPISALEKYLAAAGATNA